MKTIIGFLLALTCLTVQAEEVRVVVYSVQQDGEIDSLYSEVVTWLPDNVELCNEYLSEWYKENFIASAMHRTDFDGQVIAVRCIDWEPVTRIFEQLKQTDD